MFDFSGPGYVTCLDAPRTPIGDNPLPWSNATTGNPSPRGSGTPSSSSFSTIPPVEVLSISTGGNSALPSAITRKAINAVKSGISVASDPVWIAARSSNELKAAKDVDEALKKKIAQLDRILTGMGVTYRSGEVETFLTRHAGLELLYRRAGLAADPEKTLTHPRSQAPDGLVKELLLSLLDFYARADDQGTAKRHGLKFELVQALYLAAEKGLKTGSMYVAYLLDGHVETKTDRSAQDYASYTGNREEGRRLNELVDGFRALSPSLPSDCPWRENFDANLLLDFLCDLWPRKSLQL